MSEKDLPYFDWQSYSEVHRDEAQIMVNWHYYQDVCGYDHRFFRAILHDAFKAKFGGDPDYLSHPAWELYQQFSRQQPIAARPSDEFSPARLNRKIQQLTRRIEIFKTTFPGMYSLVADLIANVITGITITQTMIDELNSDNDLLFPYESILIALQLSIAKRNLMNLPGTSSSANQQTIHQSSTTTAERMAKYRAMQSQT
jgi:hypothetical protein